MADLATTTIRSRFDAVFADYQIAKTAHDAIADQPPTRSHDRIDDVFDDAREAVFSVAASRLGGIADKLVVYWGERLFDYDWYGSDWRRKIVGDVRRIELQLGGVGEPDASGGYDMEKVTRDWDEARSQYHDWKQLLAEGPSDRWGESNQNDIVAFKDEAEAALLSLPAPHLLAAIQKLEILWADERFDPVVDTREHLLILRDVRRFVLKRHQ